MVDLISVIVATYNREDALDAVLRGLSRQTDRDFEVLIADDVGDTVWRVSSNNPHSASND